MQYIVAEAVDNEMILKITEATSFYEALLNVGFITKEDELTPESTDEEIKEYFFDGDIVIGYLILDYAL